MGAVASVEVATSPRNAFSLAIKGGLNEVWALGRWVKARLDIFSAEEDLALALLSYRGRSAGGV